MASVDVRIEMLPGWEDDIKTLPAVKSALTKEAKSMCNSANSMAAGYTTKKWEDKKTGETKGGTKAAYAYKNTKVFANDSVALVYTKNYAAKKENLAHNTLAKVSRG